MNKWWQLTAIAVAGILIGLLSGFLLFNSGTKIALVDMDRILKEGRSGKNYQADLDRRMAAVRTELGKITDAGQRTAKSQQYGQELTSLQQEYTKKAIEESDPVIARVAKRRGITAVFSKGGAMGVIRFAQSDLTEEVLKELNK